MIKELMAYVVLLLMAGACTHPGEAETKKTEATPELKDSVPSGFMTVSTALEIEPLRQLPAGFHLDSIFKKDSLLNHQTTLYFPVSETDPLFNRKLKLFIEKHEKEYKPDERGDEYQSSVFDLWPVTEEHTGRKQSFTFRMQSYYPGAAHYNRDSAVFTGLVK